MKYGKCAKGGLILSALTLLALSGRAASAELLPRTAAPDSGQIQALPQSLFSRIALTPVWLADISGGQGFLVDRTVSGAAAAWLMWEPRPANEPSVGASRFSFGVGLRLTHLRADGTEYPGRGSARDNLLYINNPRLTALNAAIQFRFRLLGRSDSRHPLSVGFNIDAAGVSFGPARQGLARTPTTLLFVTDFSPMRGNLLLGNAADRGTLNSEIYLDLRAAPRLNVRVGMAHVATSYAFGGDRYLRFFDLGVAGVSYRLSGAPN